MLGKSAILRTSVGMANLLQLFETRAGVLGMTTVANYAGRMERRAMLCA